MVFQAFKLNHYPASSSCSLSDGIKCGSAAYNISVALRCLSMPFLRPVKMSIRALTRWELANVSCLPTCRECGYAVMYTLGTFGEWKACGETAARE